MGLVQVVVEDRGERVQTEASVVVCELKTVAEKYSSQVVVQGVFLMFGVLRSLGKSF